MKRYYAMLVISLIGLTWGLTVNSQTMDVINNAVVSVYGAGYGLKNFMEPVIGLLANGNIKLVSPLIIKFILILSLILSYVSIFKIANKDSNNKLGDIFSFAYWRHIDLGFVYKPARFKKKR